MNKLINQDPFEVGNIREGVEDSTKNSNLLAPKQEKKRVSGPTMPEQGKSVAEGKLFK